MDKYTYQRRMFICLRFEWQAVVVVKDEVWRCLCACSKLYMKQAFQIWIKVLTITTTTMPLRSIDAQVIYTSEVPPMITEDFEHNYVNVMACHKW